MGRPVDTMGWDGMGRPVDTMGWDGIENLFWEWDGMGRDGLLDPMGRFFRPIPSH